MSEWMLWMYTLFNVFRIISLWSHNYETTEVIKRKLVRQGFWYKQAINIIVLRDSLYYGYITTKQELFIIICKWLKITQGYRNIKKTLIEYKLYTDVKLSKYILPS